MFRDTRSIVMIDLSRAALRPPHGYAAASVLTALYRADDLCFGDGAAAHSRRLRPQDPRSCPHSPADLRCADAARRARSLAEQSRRPAQLSDFSTSAFP